MSKISELIHEFSDDWVSFLESSRKINNDKSFFVIDKEKSTYKLFNTDIPNAIQSFIKDKRFKVDSSLGQTNIAAIPWIAILNKEITSSVQEEFYIVYLFSRNAKKVYLSIGIGAQQFVDIFGENKKCTKKIGLANQRLLGYCNYLKKGHSFSQIKLSNSEDFNFNKRFNSISPKSLHKIANYEAGCLFTREYDLSVERLSEEVFLEDLEEYLILYKKMSSDPAIKNLISNLPASVFDQDEDLPKNIDLDYQISPFPPNTEIKRSRERSKKTSINNRSAKKNSIPKQIVGKAGEEHVYDFEYNKLKKSGNIDLAERIVKQYEDKTNFPGYDIQSFDESGGEIFIEVKSTEGLKRNNFEISENEISAARDLKEKYFIYHVVNSPKNPKIDGFIQDPISKIARKEIKIEPLIHKIRF